MLKSRIAVVAATLMVSAALWAQEPVSKSRLGGVAIGGHDAVAYRDIEREPRGDAIDGSKVYRVEYKGATWRFASAESAAKFEAEPERYQPVYNGHCANALSLGEGLVRTDGETWEIFGDELHLFYAPRGRERWLAAGEGWREYREQADAAWLKLTQ
jgi:YHS domain-containing protein